MHTRIFLRRNGFGNSPQAISSGPLQRWMAPLGAVSSAPHPHPASLLALPPSFLQTLFKLAPSVRGVLRPRPVSGGAYRQIALALFTRNPFAGDAMQLAETTQETIQEATQPQSPGGTLVDLLSRKGSEVVTVAPDCSVATAVRTMCQQKVGSVVIVEHVHPIGVFTERDVMHRIVAPGRDPVDDEGERGDDLPLCVRTARDGHPRGGGVDESEPHPPPADLRAGPTAWTHLVRRRAGVEASGAGTLAPASGRLLLPTLEEGDVVSLV